MKKSLLLFFSAIILIFLFASCGVLPSFSPASTDTPLAPPPDLIVTEELIPGTPTLTIPPPPTDVPTATLTPTITLTPSPTPTPKIYAPAGPGTPVIDFGFAPLALENIPQLTPAWQAMRSEVRQAVPSGDGGKLFVSTSNGLFVFDAAGTLLVHWRDIFTSGIPCQRCLAVNQDGSQFAVLTRNVGRWEVQVYEVQDVKWKSVRLSIPLETTFRNAENEGQVAFSPDSNFLAYSVGDSVLRVFDFQNGRQVLSSEKPLSEIQFSADSALFVARDSRNLLIYDTKSWEKPAALLLPAIDTPFAVAPDSQSLAIAFGNRLRIYHVPGFKVAREFTQPDGKARQWELSFENGSTLQGVSVEWNTARSLATVTSAAWEIQSGENVRLESVETDSPSPFPPAWNQELPFEDSTNGLNVGEYNAFRFISNEMLMINSTHAVCWLRFIIAEQNCVEDPEHIVFSSDTIAFKEIVADKRTVLQNWRGETILDVFGDYRVKALDRSGEWVLIDVRSDAADLYGKGRTRAEESVGGTFQFFAETRSLMAYTTRQKSGKFKITVIEKASGKTLAQKEEVFLFQPMLMDRAGALLLLKRDLDKNLTIVNFMEPPDYNIREVTRLSFPAEIKLMIYSTQENLLAFGLADGSVVIYSPDFELSATFQAFDSPVTALSFSPDDRYLAAASREGIKVFVVRPLPKATVTPTATP